MYLALEVPRRRADNSCMMNEIHNVYHAITQYVDAEAPKYKEEFLKDFPNDEMTIDQAKACVAEELIDSLKYDFLRE